MKQKAYTELELVGVVENTIQSIFGKELIKSALELKLDKRIHISSFEEFTVHTIVFKNGIVKYNLLSKKHTYYTMTYKQLLRELKGMFTKL